MDNTHRGQQINAIRARLAAAIRQGDGVTVLAPKLTVLQQQKSDALLAKFTSGQFAAPSNEVQTWIVEYDATSGDLPQSASLAWTASLSGTVDVTVSNSICYLRDEGATDDLLYSYDIAATTYTLSNARGTVVEAYVAVPSASLGANSGMLVRIEDGTQRFDVYVRSGDLNVDDSTDAVVSADLSGFHWLRLDAKGGSVLLSRDGRRIGYGGAKSASTAQLVAWGTANGDSSAQISLHKIRVGSR